jgi:hypothetical protein
MTNTNPSDISTTSSAPPSLLDPDAEAGPRRRLGKWAQPGVPHKGWRCVWVDDRGSPDHLCEMCEWQEVRYVHFMEHDDYPGGLEVGCDCAGHMQRSRKQAKRRERDMKNRAGRRAKWLSSKKWKVSARGNDWIKVGKHRVVIRPTEDRWTFTIAGEDSAHHESRTFATSDEAKLAAFDFRWPARSRVM